MLLLTEPVNPLLDRLEPEKNRSPDDPPEMAPDLLTAEPVGTFVPPAPDGGLRTFVLPGEVLLNEEEAPLLCDAPVGVFFPVIEGIKVVDVPDDFDPAEGAWAPPDLERPELN